MNAKNNGVYYTPELLAEYMTRHSLKSIPKSKSISILEPSCGDGVFIESLKKTLTNKNHIQHSLYCVEIDKSELRKTKAKSQQHFKNAQFIHQDFLDFHNTCKEKFDLIIGNPPYVIRKRLLQTTIEKSKYIYAQSELNEKYFRNLWSVFLIGSINLLSDTGMIAYVLPAELLQVKFSEELREKLLHTFQRIEVISFKKIIFEDIEQDTIVLFCYKKHAKAGLFFSEQHDINSLIQSPISFQKKAISSNNKKWTSHILSKDELDLLSDLQKMFQPISHYCSAVAGIVTAANNYFIIDEKTVKNYNLEKFVLPIIQRGQYINGNSIFTLNDLKDLNQKGKACYLLNFNDHDKNSFNKKHQEYLNLGIEQNINNRYKCTKRSPWYSIPGIWSSEGFFFKRCHLYPKILVNDANIMVTDSAYRIKMKEGHCIKSLVYSYYNSLSLALSELEGRFYGGGVLELTPNEFKSISIPYLQISEKTFAQFKEAFENKSTIEDISTQIDREILEKHYGIAPDTIKKLQNIKYKLTLRRLEKNKRSR